MANKTFEEQENEIIKQAEAAGLQYNYFLVTTIDRYRTLRKISDKLKESLDTDGLLVEKEYVKGRKNLYSSPALADYTKICESMNRTAATAIKIIRNFSDEGNKKGQEDPLIKAINGRGDYNDDDEAESDEK